jgi:hypothetical protein
MEGAVLALSASDKIQLAIAAITALAALIALGNVVVTFLIERRPSQPIVIAHEAGGRRFAPSSSPAAWVVDTYLTSEGAGPAFNVRFGVEFNGSATRSASARATRRPPHPARPSRR